jgi:DNA-binding NarL/FixJ family response regulator
MPIASKKILIVEDHPLFRAMLVQLINQELGLTVCGEADSVQDALRLIEQTRPDAAIVDLILAGSNGLDLIKDLTARHLPLPVLVLSMHAEALYAEQVLRAGAKGFISKEEPPAEVVAALRTVLAGARYFSERVNRTIREQPEPADEAVPLAGRGPAFRP